MNEIAERQLTETEKEEIRIYLKLIVLRRRERRLKGFYPRPVADLIWCIKEQLELREILHSIRGT